jgi:hypothetical protein
LCVATKLVTTIHRALQTGVTCDEGPDEDGITCDCSEFNNTIGVGNFTCPLLEHGTSEHYLVHNYTVNADGSIFVENCFYTEGMSSGLESYCFSYSISYSSVLGPTMECEMKANGISVRSSCDYQQESCPARAATLLRDLANEHKSTTRARQLLA